MRRTFRRRHQTALTMRAAQRLVRRYPEPWRARYEDEVLALLEESGVRWRDLFDLSRGLITERALSLFEPGDRPRATAAAIGLLPVCLVVASWLVAAAVGRTLFQVVGPIPTDFLMIWQVLLLGAVHVAVARRVIRRLRHGVNILNRVRSDEPGFTVLRLSAWMNALNISLLLGYWTPSMPWLAWAPLGPLFMLAFYAPASRSALSAQIGAVVFQLDKARREMKWARLELERCETLAAQRQASPLDEARATMSRLEREISQALASLHAMGYRARHRVKA